MSTTVVGKGLAGVVAANSGICWIDGDAGVLAYRGIDIHELAEKSTFEEAATCCGSAGFPAGRSWTSSARQLAEARVLDPKIIELLRSFPQSATPMEVLADGCFGAEFYDPDEKRQCARRATCARVSG